MGKPKEPPPAFFHHLKELSAGCRAELELEGYELEAYDSLPHGEWPDGWWDMNRLRVVGRRDGQQKSVVKTVQPDMFNPPQSAVTAQVHRGISLVKDELSPEAIKIIKKEFTYDNPKFAQLERLGKWTGNTDRTIETWEEDQEDLLLPRGREAEVSKILDDFGLTPLWEDHRLECRPVRFGMGPKADVLTMRDDQERLIVAALERETCLLRAAAGCLAVGTEIGINRAGKSFKIRIEDLVYRFNGGRITWGTGNRTNKIKGSGMYWDPEIPTMVRSVTPEGYIRLHHLRDAYESGTRRTYAVYTECGHCIRATKEHRFLTPGAGWQKLEDLTEGDLLLVEGRRGGENRAPKKRYEAATGMKSHPHARRCGERGGYRVDVHRLVMEASINEMPLADFIGAIRQGDVTRLTFLNPSKFHVHHLDGDHLNNDLSNLMVLAPGEHYRLHGEEGGWKNVTSRVASTRIKAIVFSDEEPTYDLEMDGEPRNFLANGFVVHNSGKTEVAIELIRRIGQPALVIVWSSGLFEQWVRRICKRWGWSEKSVGMIGKGKYRLGAVTIAMQQALKNRITQVSDEFGVVIADEVQRFAAPTFRDVIAKLPARYRIGLSEDEKRKDRMHMLIYDHFGKVAAEVSRHELIGRGDLCEVEIEAVPTDVRFKVLDECPAKERGALVGEMWGGIVDVLVEEEGRNDMIANIAAREVAARHELGQCVIVFTDRVEHARELSRRIAVHYETPCGLCLGGPENKAVFEETCERLDSGDLRCAVATSCMYQGQDIPRLTVGIVATPTANNKQLLSQQVGRLRRKFEGKGTGKLYYVWDSGTFPGHINNLRRWYGRRLVRVTEWEDLNV